MDQAPQPHKGASKETDLIYEGIATH